MYKIIAEHNGGIVWDENILFEHTDAEFLKFVADRVVEGIRLANTDRVWIGYESTDEILPLHSEWEAGDVVGQVRWEWVPNSLIGS